MKLMPVSKVKKLIINNYFAPNAKHLSPILSRWLDKYFGANVLSQTNQSICL